MTKCFLEPSLSRDLTVIRDLEVSWKGLVEPANRGNKGEWGEIDLYGS